MPAVTFENKEQRMALLQWLKNKGYYWHGDSSLSPEDVERLWPFTSYKFLEPYDSRAIHGLRRTDQRNIVTLPQFCEYINTGKIPI